MKIAVVTMWAGNYMGIAEITLPLMREYCKSHNYKLHEIWLEDGNEYHFKKHEYFIKLFANSVDAIFYLDIDCAITNMTVKVEDFIEKDYDFYITQDVNELNGGSLILKNTAWARAYNDLILENRSKYANEQNVYVAFQEVHVMSLKTKILPHPSINSYRYDLYPEFPEIRSREQGHWHEGDFILHTPAAPMNVRIETLKNAKIIR